MNLVSAQPPSAMPFAWAVMSMSTGKKCTPGSARQRCSVQWGGATPLCDVCAHMHAHVGIFCVSGAHHVGMGLMSSLPGFGIGG